MELQLQAGESSCTSVGALPQLGQPLRGLEPVVPREVAADGQGSPTAGTVPFG